MLSISTLRDEIHFARVNNEELRNLFRVIDFLKWIITLALAAAFIFGIWFILYGYQTPRGATEPRVSGSQPIQQKSDSARVALQPSEQKPLQAIDRLTNGKTTQEGSSRLAQALPASTSSVNSGWQTTPVIEQVAEAELVGTNPLASDVVVYRVESAPLPVPIRASDAIDIAPVEKPKSVQPFQVTSPIAGLESLEQNRAAVQTAETNPQTDKPDSDVTGQPMVAESLQAPDEGVVLDGSVPAIFQEPSQTGAVGQAGSEIQASRVIAAVATDVNASSPPLRREREVTAAVESGPNAEFTATSPGDLITATLHDETWLRQQPSDNYFIQISSTRNKPFLVRFAALLPLEMQRALYLFRVDQSGERIYVLCAGSFSSRQEAAVALSALPAKLRKYGAFPRRFSAAQLEIEQVRTALRTADSQ